MEPQGPGSGRFMPRLLYFQVLWVMTFDPHPWRAFIYF